MSDERNNVETECEECGCPLFVPPGSLAPNRFWWCDTCYYDGYDFHVGAGDES